MHIEINVSVDIRPRHRRETFEHAFRELFSREVAVFQKSTGFDLDIANGTEFFDKCTEGMKGGDGL